MGLNVIYYGPPGTGKTYMLQQMKEDYIDYLISDDEIKNAYIRSSKDWILIALIILQNGNKVSSTDVEKKIFSLRIAGFNSNVSTVLENHSIDFNDPLFEPSSPQIFKERQNIWSVNVDKILEYNHTFFDNYLSRNAVKERFKYVTFHQSFVYEDFIEGIRPELDDSSKQVNSDQAGNRITEAAEGKTPYIIKESSIKYSIQDGVFKQICKEALEDENKDFAIFIDEINRGNISEIFGELITLIEEDKRVGSQNQLEVTLPYSKKKFGVPKNLYIIGTMNSTDRSIALIDIALRRRFEFIPMNCNLEILTTHITNKDINPFDIQGVNLIKMLEVMNKRITFLLDSNFVIGHAFFIHVSTVEDIIKIMKSKIVPLLEEYFYEDLEKIQLIFSDIDASGELHPHAIYRHEMMNVDNLFSNSGDLILEDKKSFFIGVITKDSLTKIYTKREV